VAIAALAQILGAPSALPGAPPSSPVTLVAAVVVLLGLMAARPWLVAMLLWRRGYGRLARPHEAVLGEAGISIRSEHSGTDYRWEAIAVAHESRRAFLLGLSSGPAGPFIILPKRGLVAGGVENLRELLRRKVGHVRLPG